MKLDFLFPSYSRSNRLQAMPVLFIILLGFGCRSDRPLDFDLLTNPGDRGRVDSTIIINLAVETSFSDTLSATGRSPFLELGHLDNVSSQILMRFNSVPDSVTIRDATLIIDTNTIYTDGQNRSIFSATIHRVREQWVENSATGENFGGSFDSNPIAEATILSIGADFSDDDSLFIESIRFGFDEDGIQLVRNWTDTTRADNFGIIIKHSANSDFIKEFFSVNGIFNQPRLELEILTSSGIDTIVSVADEDVSIVTEDGSLQQGPLYVDDFLGLQTVLDFDLSAIPRESSINDATLELTIDRDASRIKSTGYAFQITRLAEEFSGPSTLSLDSDFIPINQVVSNSITTLSIPVGGLVQFWVTEDVQNNGILLRAVNPGRDASKLVLRSNRLAPDSGPRLVIHFSSAPTAP